MSTTKRVRFSSYAVLSFCLVIIACFSSFSTLAHAAAQPTAVSYTWDVFGIIGPTCSSTSSNYPSCVLNSCYQKTNAFWSDNPSTLSNDTGAYGYEYIDYSSLTVEPYCGDNNAIWLGVNGLTSADLNAEGKYLTCTQNSEYHEVNTAVSNCLDTAYNQALSPAAPVVTCSATYNPTTNQITYTAVPKTASSIYTYKWFNDVPYPSPASFPGLYTNEFYTDAQVQALAQDGQFSGTTGSSVTVTYPYPYTDTADISTYTFDDRGFAYSRVMNDGALRSARVVATDAAGNSSSVTCPYTPLTYVPKTGVVGSAPVFDYYSASVVATPNKDKSTASVVGTFSFTLKPVGVAVNLVTPSSIAISLEDANSQTDYQAGIASVTSAPADSVYQPGKNYLITVKTVPITSTSGLGPNGTSGLTQASTKIHFFLNSVAWQSVGGTSVTQNFLNWTSLYPNQYVAFTPPTTPVTTVPVTPVTTPTVAPKPTISFSSTASTIAYGNSTSLRWSATNATVCTSSTFSIPTANSTSGSITVGPLKSNTNYTITCTGSAGSTSANTAVMVSPQVSMPTTPPITVTPPVPTAPTPLAPTVTLTASPTAITTGQASVLSWTSQNASFCTSQNTQFGIGRLATSGSVKISPSASASYVMSCTSSANVSAQAQVIIVVSSPAVTPPPVATYPTFTPPPTVVSAPVITLTASPTSIAANNQSKITWSITNNPTSCTPTGGDSSWSNSANNHFISGNNGGAYFSTALLTQTTTYGLTCSNTGGSASANVTIVVIPLPSPTPAAPITPTPVVTTPPVTTPPLATVRAPLVILNGSVSPLVFNGQDLITWKVTNSPTSCTASAGNPTWTNQTSSYFIAGNSNALGGTNFSTGPLTQTITYTLTCSNAGGSGSGSVTIVVLPPVPPVVTTLLPTSIAPGTLVTVYGVNFAVNPVVLLQGQYPATIAGKETSPNTLTFTIPAIGGKIGVITKLIDTFEVGIGPNNVSNAFPITITVPAAVPAYSPAISGSK